MILPTYLNNAVLSGGGGDITVIEAVIDDIMTIDDETDVFTIENEVEVVTIDIS